MDVAEHEKAYEITAELPGMDESNIDVKFSDGTLTIKGEKKDEREERQKDYHLSERRYGSFQRSFSVPDGVDADKIEAHFKNGVLTVTLPKKPEAQKSEKKIANAWGSFDRNFDWWKESGKDRLVEPQLPFRNGRSDLLTGSGSRLDIQNINLLATFSSMLSTRVTGISSACSSRRRWKHC